MRNTLYRFIPNCNYLISITIKKLPVFLLLLVISLSACTSPDTINNTKGSTSSKIVHLNTKSVSSNQVDLTSSTDTELTLKPQMPAVSGLEAKKPVEDPVIRKIREEAKDDISSILRTPALKCSNADFLDRVHAIEQTLSLPETTKSPSDSVYSEGCRVRAAVRAGDCSPLSETARKDCEKLDASREIFREKSWESNPKYTGITNLYRQYFIAPVAFPPSEYLSK